MPVGAGIAAIGGGAISAGGSFLASNAQADAAHQASMVMRNASLKTLRFQKDAFREGKQALMPYSTVGKGALYSLAQLFGLPASGMGRGMPRLEGGSPQVTDALQTFRDSPEYQMPLQEGLKAVEYSRAKIGGLQNPGTAAELMKMGQTYASTRLDGYIGKLMGIAGIGQNAAGAIAGQASTGAQVMGNTMMQGATAVGQGILGAGQATASGYMGMANAIGGAVQSAGSNAMMYDMYNMRYSQPQANIGYGTSPGGDWLGPSGQPGWIPPPTNNIAVMNPTHHMGPR